MNNEQNQIKSDIRNQDMYGFLFVYFTGESEVGEQVYFSLSEDGFHWKDLNNGKAVITSNVGEKGVRDPFILRSEIDQKYYIIATDLRIANGKGWGCAQYQGSRNLVIFKSEDLLNWEGPQLVDIAVPGAGCVWAPEAIYDKNKEEYLVFWASMVTEDGDIEAKQRIYAARTKDFNTFTETEKFIERDNHVIDTTMIEVDGVYYRFSKDETTKNIRIDKSTSLDKDSFEYVSFPVLEGLDNVEGPLIFQLNHEHKWCLMVDEFVKNTGYLPLIINDLEKDDFQIMKPEEYDLGENKKRHGSVMRITKEEFDTLMYRFQN